MEYPDGMVAEDHGHGGNEEMKLGFGFGCGRMRCCEFRVLDAAARRGLFCGGGFPAEIHHAYTWQIPATATACN